MLHHFKESESWDSWNTSKKNSQQTRSFFALSPKPQTEKPPEPDYFHELALEPQIRRAPQVYFVFGVPFEMEQNISYYI